MISGLRVIRLIILCTTLITISALISPPISNASNLDAGSSFYDDIERLSAYGLIDSSMLGARPFDRREIARLIAEADRKTRTEPLFNSLPHSIRIILKRLRFEFRDEDDLSYIKPIRSAGIRYSHLSGDKSNFAGINASQEPFNYNNEGIASNSNDLFADLEGDARFDSLSFHLNPILALSDTSTGNDMTLRIQKGYGKLYLGKFSLELGKDSIWWGQGRHGSIILTNNAKPFGLVRVSNEDPFILPLLGLFKMDFFLTKLGSNRTHSNPYFGGLRFSFKPTPSFEFGLSRTAITGGDGMPNIGIGDIGTILIGKNLGNKDAGESNQIAGFDARLRVDALKAFIYGEMYGEDEAGYLPYKWAYIAGIYFSDIIGADLRVEYADTASDFSGWYDHSAYSSGYTFKGRLMGHHMGGDAKDTFIGTSFHLDSLSKVSLHYDYEERGVSNQNPETHHQFVLGLERPLSRQLRLKLKGGLEKVGNFGHTSGLDKDNNFMEIALFRNF